jgi:hypothetical protein
MSLSKLCVDSLTSREQQLLIKDSSTVTTQKVTTQSNQVGLYQFGNLKPGIYVVRCYLPEQYIYYRRAETQSADEDRTILDNGKNIVVITP